MKQIQWLQMTSLLRHTGTTTDVRLSVSVLNRQRRAVGLLM